jgi:hypothetical protein
MLDIYLKLMYIKVLSKRDMGNLQEASHTQMCREAHDGHEAYYFFGQKEDKNHLF